MRTAASATLAVIGFVALGTLYIAQSGFEGKGMNLLQNDKEVDMRFINFIGKYILSNFSIIETVLPKELPVQGRVPSAHGNLRTHSTACR